MDIESAVQISDFLRRNGMEGVLLLASDGKILSANRAAESLLGYGAGQLTTMQISDIWRDSFPWSRALQDRPQPQDAGLTRHNGDTLAAAVTLSPLAEADDAESMMTFISRAELDQLNESLMYAQRLAGVGTLTASVAHELTNPISIITAACANLIDELNDGPIGREDLVQALELIEQSAFRCARIVDMLRNYAHDVGPEGVAVDDISVAITSPTAVLEDALTMVEQQFRKQARVTVEADVQPSLTTLFCDHHRITQVLINLLLNARDAMQPEGGIIQVRFWSPDPLFERSLVEQLGPDANTADLFAFSVTDSGRGLAPEHMERLFEPFFTTKPNGQGTGLGLFIARSIVAQHGGRIFAQNNPEGGMTFTVALPRKQ